MTEATVNSVERLLRLALTTASEIDLPTALTELLEIALETTGAVHGDVGVFEADGTRTVLGMRGEPQPTEAFPIVVAGIRWGDLHLAGAERDDAQLGRLTDAAGALVANARIYEEARLAQRWIAASEQINERLLSGDLAGGDVSPVAGLVVELADAAFVGLLSASAERYAAQYGPLSYNSTAMRDPGFLALPGTIARAVRARAELGPLEVEASRSIGGLGPTMIIPWGDSDDEPDGALLVARGAGARQFTAAERTMAERFVRSVSIARALASARSDRERLALVDERDRIARDLHDHVIQSLFAVGLSLQGIAAQTTGQAAARLSAQIDAVDATIRQIRQTIFELGSTPSELGYSQKQRLNALVRTTLEGEGIDSSLDFRGPVDTLIDSDLSDEVEAVVREALSNVVRHAHASRVDISVEVTSEHVRIVVTDNGRGLPLLRRSSGLDNLAERAKKRGGTFAIAGRAPSGTTLDWMVPAP